MTPLNDDELVRSFEDQLRRWSRRPPTIPGAVARVRILARLPRASRGVSWLRLAAAAALLFVLVVAAWRGAPRWAGETKAGLEVALAPSTGPDVVVWVLDNRTTVYFAMSRDGSARGGLS